MRGADSASDGTWFSAAPRARIDDALLVLVRIAMIQTIGNADRSRLFKNRPSVRLQLPRANSRSLKATTRMGPHLPEFLLHHRRLPPPPSQKNWKKKSKFNLRKEEKSEGKSVWCRGRFPSKIPPIGNPPLHWWHCVTPRSFVVKRRKS